MESKRAIKFRFKREMRELIYIIQNENKQLFPQAFMKNQRTSQNGADLYDYPAQNSSNGKNTSVVHNFINYENDNFFEAEDDRLIVTKKIQDHHHFWERIDTAFFKTNISKELLQYMETFY
jgi:hypothetical protein